MKTAKEGRVKVAAGHPLPYRSWVGKTARRALLVAALLLVATALGVLRKRAPKPFPQLSPPDDARHVVVVSIDGLKPEYLEKRDDLGLAIPTLRALLARGAFAEMESVFPTVTYPAHTTLVTGVSPAKHGVGTNAPFDPFGELRGDWYFSAKSIRVPTLWAVARERGLSTGSVYWPVTVDAAIDWDFPQFWRKKTSDDDALLRAMITPPLATEVEDRYGSLPAEHRSDEERANAAELLLATRRPRLTFVYFTDLDTAEHRYGPLTPEAAETLEAIDHELARIVDATKRGGIFPRTTFVVVSDHGFARVDRVLRPGVLLARAGLVDLSPAGRVTAFRAGVVTAGGTCGVVLADPNDEDAKGKTLAALVAAKGDPALGIARIWTAEEAAKAGGFPGAAFVIEAEKGFETASGYEGPPVVASPHRGAHGYPPSDPDMRAMALFSGDGIAPAASLPRVRAVDVAPTIAKLLDLPLDSAEGEPLSAVLR